MAQADIITNEESSRLIRFIDSKEKEFGIGLKALTDDKCAIDFCKIKAQYDEAGYITSHQLRMLRSLKDYLEIQFPVAQIDN